MDSTREEVDKELKGAFKTKGLKGCQKLIETRLSEWRRIPMNIAVIGSSDTGKSSLVNAFLDLDADDDGATAVGCEETTRTIAEYKHPDNEQLVFTDLPGVASSDFPQAKYMEETDVDKYDFFLLVTSKRFLETDAWLAEELIKRNKKFLLVRTHMDEDVMVNDERAHCDCLNEDELIAQIRAETETQLRILWTSASPNDMKVFVLDSYGTDKYDFPALERQLIENFPAPKQEALLLTLRTKYKEMIDQKVVCLRSRIWKAAAL